MKTFQSIQNIDLQFNYGILQCSYIVKVKYWITLNNKFCYTPGNVSVSSKHELSIFDDGNRVTFPITPVVKGSGSPAVSGGAVAQHPLRVQSNSRSQELIKTTLMKCIATYYSGMGYKTYNEKQR